MKPMLHALVRPPGPALQRATRTFLRHQAIDVERAAGQHAAYVRVLERAGARIVELPVLDDLPDAAFVEDALVSIGGPPILARPRLGARRAELPSVERGLAGLLPPGKRLRRIEAPGSLEGGDVLALGRRLIIGLSGRTDRRGAQQLVALARPYGWQVTEVPVEGCLHLKTAATRVGPRTVLINPSWVDRAAFAGLEVLEVDPDEPFAANTLRLGSTLLVSAAHRRTARRLRDRGFELRSVDLSELEKAEAGLTCLSVLLSGP